MRGRQGRGIEHDHPEHRRRADHLDGERIAPLAVQRFGWPASDGFPLVDGLEAFCFGAFSAFGLRTSFFDFC